jgi:hypothetical protein
MVWELVISALENTLKPAKPFSWVDERGVI